MYVKYLEFFCVNVACIHIIQASWIFPFSIWVISQYSVHFLSLFHCSGFGHWERFRLARRSVWCAPLYGVSLEQFLAFCLIWHISILHMFQPLPAYFQAPRISWFSEEHSFLLLGSTCAPVVLLAAQIKWLLGPLS